MSKYRVLLTDYAWPDVQIERTVLAAANAELVVSDSPAPDRLAQLAVGADAILTCWADTNRQVLEATKNCRIVARMGIGLDNIDVEYCTLRRIPVTNVPDYCQLEVAEHALALMFALARQIAACHADTKAGVYRAGTDRSPRRIEGATLGIVGLGRIGRLVAEKAVGLGMKVLACGREQPTQTGLVEPVGLDDLLARSDFVSLHLPLVAETRHLIGAERLAQMKPTSCLINTSRGGIVDHAALAAALHANRLAGAALDVQDPEPPPLDRPPFNDPRVIVTPHIAFVSEHSVNELRRRAATQVAVCLSGGTPENIVNRRALGDARG